MARFSDGTATSVRSKDLIAHGVNPVFAKWVAGNDSGFRTFAVENKTGALMAERLNGAVIDIEFAWKDFAKDTRTFQCDIAATVEAAIADTIGSSFADFIVDAEKVVERSTAFVEDVELAVAVDHVGNVRVMLSAILDDGRAEPLVATTVASDGESVTDGRPGDQPPSEPSAGGFLKIKSVGLPYGDAEGEFDLSSVREYKMANRRWVDEEGDSWIAEMKNAARQSHPRIVAARQGIGPDTSSAEFRNLMKNAFVPVAPVEAPVADVVVAVPAKKKSAGAPKNYVKPEQLNFFETLCPPAPTKAYAMAA